VRVLADQCTHLGGPLHQGRVATVDGVDCVTCPWHGSVFQLADGAVRHGPATARQPAFDTRVTGSGLVQVSLSAPRRASAPRAARSAAAPRSTGTSSSR
jgi:nitrite reductase/ring-hydroxylating ferredoxin subunit